MIRFLSKSGQIGLCSQYGLRPYPSRPTRAICSRCVEAETVSADPNALCGAQRSMTREGRLDPRELHRANVSAAGAIVSRLTGPSGGRLHRGSRSLVGAAPSPVVLSLL